MNIGEMERIDFGLDWTPNTSHVSLFAAAASGAFARRGLDVHFVSPGLHGGGHG